MLTKREFLAQIKRECAITTHLASRLAPRHLGHRLTPKQRSTLELLRFLTIIQEGMLSFMLDGSWERWEALDKASAGTGLKDVAKALQGQVKAIERRLRPLSEAAFARTRAHVPAGGRMKLPEACLQFLVIMPAAYRMQLFLQAKAAGLHMLKSSDLWHGKAS